MTHFSIHFALFVVKTAVSVSVCGCVCSLFDISSLLHPLPARQVVLIGRNAATQSGLSAPRVEEGVVSREVLHRPTHCLLLIRCSS